MTVSQMSTGVAAVSSAEINNQLGVPSLQAAAPDQLVLHSNSSLLLVHYANLISNNACCHILHVDKTLTTGS